jgi:hypothetical protein
MSSNGQTEERAATADLDLDMEDHDRAQVGVASF